MRFRCTLIRKCILKRPFIQKRRWTSSCRNRQVPSNYKGDSRVSSVNIVKYHEEYVRPYLNETPVSPIVVVEVTSLKIGKDIMKLHHNLII